MVQITFFPFFLCLNGKRRSRRKKKLLVSYSALPALPAKTCASARGTLGCSNEGSCQAGLDLTAMRKASALAVTSRCGTQSEERESAFGQSVLRMAGMSTLGSRLREPASSCQWQFFEQLFPLDQSTTILEKFLSALKWFSCQLSQQHNSLFSGQRVTWSCFIQSRV